MSAYSNADRRELRALFTANGVDPVRAGVIVDLACLASERAVDLVFEVVGRAPDHGAKMMALELGAQLASFRLKGVLERAHELGAAAGLPQWHAAIELPS